MNNHAGMACPDPQEYMRGLRLITHPSIYRQLLLEFTYTSQLLLLLLTLSIQARGYSRPS